MNFTRKDTWITGKKKYEECRVRNPQTARKI